MDGKVSNIEFCGTKKITYAEVNPKPLYNFTVSHNKTMLDDIAYILQIVQYTLQPSNIFNIFPI